MAKLKNVWRTATVVGAGLTALTLTLDTAGVASATAGPAQLELCDEANNFTIDGWEGSSLLLHVGPGGCKTVTFNVQGTSGGSDGPVETIQFFVDNQVVADELGQVTYAVDHGMTVVISGLNPSDFHFAES